MSRLTGYGEVLLTKSEHERYLGIVRRVEWQGREFDRTAGEWVPMCPHCGGYRSEGHRDGCDIAATLRDEALSEIAA